MPLEEPAWWYGDAGSQGPIVSILAPLGRLYGAVTQARFARANPYRARISVICAGNFTAGGAGKTPLALYLARLLAERGARPAFLTRGYGGRERGPVWVDEGPGAAARFGDEALLLKRVAPTLVARDRALGAQAIEDSGRGFTVIVMDDGLQNPALAKDLSLAVVDGERGLGNGEVIPAGPLRAPIDFQLSLVDAVVVREPAATPRPEDGIHALLRRRFPGPVLAAGTRACGDTRALLGKEVVAFAGIANPQRFFALIESLGARLYGRIAFPDHHVFTDADAVTLLSRAEESGARLITTEKDWVRLAGAERPIKALLDRTTALAIELFLEERDVKRLAALLDAALRRDGR